MQRVVEFIRAAEVSLILPLIEASDTDDAGTKGALMIVAGNTEDTAWDDIADTG